MAFVKEAAKGNLGVLSINYQEALSYLGA